MSTATKVTHTPGPWRIYNDYKWIKSLTTDSIVAVVEPSCHHTTEQEANARLIATAPDYYKAVDYWLEQIYDGEPLKDWQVELIAAHRKAKGE